MKIKLFPCLLLCFAIPSLADADSIASPQADTAAPTIGDLLKTKQQAYDDSRMLFIAHDFTAAEKALESGNIAPAGTAKWNAESGYSLARMALSLHVRGDVTAATPIIQLALSQFAIAEQKFGSADKPEEIANEREFVGYLYEHLLGDPLKAKAYYTQAVTLAPKAGHAAEYLDRLNRSLAEEAAKRDYAASVQ